jgi:hypothetical protein
LIGHPQLRERPPMFHVQHSQTLQAARASRHVFAAFLSKLARHVALIACLMVIGGATGRFALSPLGIFLMAAAAAVLHCAGSYLKQTVSRPAPLPRLRL